MVPVDGLMGSVGIGARAKSRFLAPLAVGYDSPAPSTSECFGERKTTARCGPSHVLRDMTHHAQAPENGLDSIRVISDRSALGDLAGVWNTVLERCPRRNVFLTWEWISNWVDVYLEDDDLLTIVAYQGGEPQAIAPLCVQKRRLRGGIELKVLRFLGSGEVTADHLDMMVTGDSPGEWSRRIWDQLFGPLRRRWDVFEYYDAPANSPVLDAFRTLVGRDKRCLKSEIVDYSVCPYVDLPETWEAFLARWGTAPRRYKLTYSMKKLAEQGKLETRLCETSEELRGQMESFIALHQKSWNERGEPGAFSDARFAEFHRRVARDFLKKGFLFLYSFHLDGAHVGSLYGFEYDKTLYFYLMGFERNPVKNVSTGTAIVGYSIEEAIRRGCREFDFLRGAEEYKYRWTSTDRRNPSVRFYNRSGGGYAVLVRNSSYRFAKRVLKPLLGKHVDRLKKLTGR
jgi:CelD/BcsL family acetyltransferase involved in cellulose biosynthesis